MKNKILLGLCWKLLERLGVQGIQFVLQIILARLLVPEHYGVLSMMIIFTNIANTFVQSGFNTALVQNKDVTDDDYSSVLWISLSVAVGLYVVLFISAPWIAFFYDMPDILVPFRVLSLILIPGALNSVQIAKISREMNFKQAFKSNLVAIIISGVAGIICAYLNAGIWALIVQSIFNVTIACIVMWFDIGWRPRFVCDLRRVKELFSFGWKLLVSSLLDTLYQDLRSLVVGKKYNSSTLAFYNRGKQFPQFVINVINNAVQSVMLPAMSEKQDCKNEVKILMRNAISISAYIIFPMMAGLAAVSEQLVVLLLTDKWLPCVPYMQIYCFTLAFTPVHTCNLQAINAMGRSDLFLKLEIIKKIYGVLALLIAVWCFDSPIAIALTGVFTAFISWFVNALPNKKLISYSYLEQINDVFPALLMSMIMYGVVVNIKVVALPIVLLLIIKVFVGITVYLVISMIIKPKSYLTLVEMIVKEIKKP